MNFMAQGCTFRFGSLEGCRRAFCPEHRGHVTYDIAFFEVRKDVYGKDFTQDRAKNFPDICIGC